MYHLQREKTQSYRAPIANGTYNSTMISNNKKKHYNKIEKYELFIPCTHLQVKPALSKTNCTV